jgi:hypothetical protein
MKRYRTVALAILIASLAFITYERKYRVQAAGDGDPDTYLPLPAPDSGLKPGDLIIGDIRKVDIANKMMIVRLDNGMDQTLKLADDTQMVVTAVDPNGVPINLKQLSTYYGSDVSIHWREENGAKVATSIDVTHQRQKRSKRRGS